MAARLRWLSIAMYLSSSIHSPLHIWRILLRLVVNLTAGDQGTVEFSMSVCHLRYVFLSKIWIVIGTADLPFHIWRGRRMACAQCRKINADFSLRPSDTLLSMPICGFSRLLVASLWKLFISFYRDPHSGLLKVNANGVCAEMQVRVHLNFHFPLILRDYMTVLEFTGINILMLTVTSVSIATSATKSGSRENLNIQYH